MIELENEEKYISMKEAQKKIVKFVFISLSFFSYFDIHGFWPTV